MADKDSRPDTTGSRAAGAPKDRLTCLVSVSALPKAGMSLHVEARDDELAGIAERLGIPAVRRIDADVKVARWRADGVKITGRLTADVVQTDVVTLDPIEQAVSEDVDLVFVPDHSRLARIAHPTDGELHLDPEGDDIPDTFSGDKIDLGEALTEILALGLDPYPRGAGATFEEIDTDPEPEAGRVSPFAKLEKLKPGGK